ncbi:MAG TPA: hypothetical protein PKA06_14780, partial [Gemmatales bacterium]|nr:hypothetical protein [Gemmatales bacterium]
VMNFKHARYISLINLLADREISPEYLTKTDCSRAMSKHLVQWLGDEKARLQVVEAMQRVQSSVARPGACQRAVDHLLAAIDQTRAAA